MVGFGLALVQEFGRGAALPPVGLLLVLELGLAVQPGGPLMRVGSRHTVGPLDEIQLVRLRLALA